MIGAGRLAEPEQIVEAVLETLGVSQDLKGETVLVTAGPTYEPIDPVRFIGNRSSGKMGYASRRNGDPARRARGTDIGADGAEATGGGGVRGRRVGGADAACGDGALPGRDDRHQDGGCGGFRPTKAAAQKIKREKGISLELEPTGDILAELGANKFPKHIIIGFAAETENLIENARKKLTKKNVDAIVLNDVSRTDIGFGSDQNAITIVTRRSRSKCPCARKQECAGRVLDRR